MKAKIVYLALALALVFSLAAVVVPAGPAMADPGTYYVSTTGNDTTGDGSQGNSWRTIQHAIDDATVSNGDTINVAAGTYQEDMTINKELTLQGAGKTTTTILRNTSTSQVVLIQADNVKMDGFKVDGGTSPYACSNLVKLSTAGSPPYENIEITNCHILHSANSAVNLSGKDKDSVGSGYKVNDNIIEYFADGSGEAGVYANFALDVEVKRNTITNSNPWTAYGYSSGGTGVYFFDYSGGTISDNTFSKCYGAVMVNSNVAETYVADNAISQSRYGILEVEAFAKIHITDNTITTAQLKTPPTYHSEKGIVLGGDGDWYDSCPPYNWQVDNLQHEVSGNTITGTYKGGEGSIGIVVQPGMLDQDYGASGMVTGNTITNYDNGLKVYGTYGLTNHVHARFAFNNIVDCTTDGEVDSWTGAAGSIDAENNWWGAPTGPTSASDRYDCDPWLTAPVGEADSETIDGGGTMTDTPAGGDVTITATGNHTLTVATYASNPGGAPTFHASGNYWDVHLDSDTGVTSLTIQFCPATSAMLIYYWNGSSWQPCSNQSYSAGCIVVTITGSTHPSLSDLSGQGFGSGSPYLIAPAAPAQPVPVVPSVLAGLAAALAAGFVAFALRRSIMSQKS